MNLKDPERYSRHILLKDFGLNGQQKIWNAHALIIGAGGLGSPTAYYMASAGIGQITLIDDDRVELSNLQRQILHETHAIGEYKAISGQKTLHRINPDVKVTPVLKRLDLNLMRELSQNVSVVIDCCDNFATRQVVNKVCVEKSLPLVSASALAFDGQIAVFDLRQKDAPCYSCLYSEDLSFTDRKAAQFGVFAPMLGIMGSMQAAEALKLIAEIGTSLNNRFLIFDALTTRFTEMTIFKNPDCPVCSKI